MTDLPISLPEGFIAIVNSGDEVTIGQVIAQKTAYQEEVVNIAQELSVASDKAGKLIKKSPGDNVESGDVIAVKKGFLGLNEEAVVSRIQGTVVRYERDTGNLVIVSSLKSFTTDIVSPVDGIIGLCDNEQIVVGTEKDVYLAKKGTGSNTQGEVFVLDDAFSLIDNDDARTKLYYALDSRAIGKIVAGKSFSRELLIKGAGIGALGIVGTEIPDEDIEYLSQRKLEIPIIVVDDEVIEKLKKWKGKKIYLDSQAKAIIFLHI